MEVEEGAVGPLYMQLPTTGSKMDYSFGIGAANPMFCSAPGASRGVAARQIIPLTPRSSSCRIRDLGKDSKISSPEQAEWRFLRRYRLLAAANSLEPAHDAQLLLRARGGGQSFQVQIHQTPMSTVLAPASRWLANPRAEAQPDQGYKAVSPWIASGRQRL